MSEQKTEVKTAPRPCIYCGGSGVIRTTHIKRDDKGNEIETVLHEENCSAC